MSLKTTIKLALGKLSFGVAHILLKPLRYFLSNKVYLVAPTDPGSYGDSAMLVATITKLQAKNIHPIVIGRGGEWKKELANYNLVTKTRAIQGLYSRFKSWPLLVIYFIIDRPRSVYLFGADVMDGFYSVERSLARMSILHLATAFSKDVRLLGFSFNESPSEECAAYLSTISRSGVQLFARDSVSSQRLNSRGILNTHVSDIAFTLEPKKDFKFNVFNTYICVNINAIQYQKFGDLYVTKVIEYINALHQLGLNIVFLQHDDRLYNGLSDWSLMKKIYDRLDDKSKAYLFEDRLNAQEIRALVSKSKFCIVGRKHMGVGALGEGIPTMFFGYQGKQEGLLRSFNIDPSVALLDPSLSSKDWLLQTTTFIDSLEITKEKVRVALPLVMSLSEKNFQ